MFPIPALLLSVLTNRRFALLLIASLMPLLSFGQSSSVSGASDPAALPSPPPVQASLERANRLRQLFSSASADVKRRRMLRRRDAERFRIDLSGTWNHIMTQKSAH